MACGVAVYRGYAYNYYGCQTGFAATAFPNPASQQITIEQSPTVTTTSDVLDESQSLQLINANQTEIAPNSDVFLFDKFGSQIFSSKAQTKKTILDVSNIPNGIYVLKIVAGSNVYTRQIVISK